MPACLTAVFLSAENILSRLKDLDMQCFIKVNVDWTGAFGDCFMPLMRDQRVWYPLYFLLLLYVAVKFRWKALPFILLGVVTVALSDVISSHLLKEFIGRIRPCHEEQLVGIMKLRVGYCPNSGSFTSSHAVNHFSLATFFYLTLRPYFKRRALLFFLWAALIAYAQVYVGVHYPGDVLCGAILGVLIGIGTAYFFKKYFNFQKGLMRK